MLVWQISPYLLENMAVSALTTTVFAQLGRELNQSKSHPVRSVFPTDTILTSFLVAAPATLLTVLVLFSSDLTSDDVVCRFSVDLFVEICKLRC